VVPRAPATATIIEFTHRATSGLALALVVALLVWAFRAYPRRHAVRAGAVLSLVFIVTEALIGAGLVLFEHVADNASLMRGFSLTAHLINTLTLLGCLTLTAWWASGGAPVRLRGPGLWPAVASLVAVMLVGVSGAIAALGDTLFPAASLAEGLRQDVSPAVHLFVRLRVLHPFLAIAGGFWLLSYATSRPVMGSDRVTRKLGWWVAVLVLVQIAAGVVNLLLLAPVWMQIVHLLLADLLWITLVLLCARKLSREPARALS
jgi:heme A synthase